jgi:ribosome-binding protein aMBF1 (putative translation factor)
MKSIKEKNKRFKSSKDFGAFLKLSEIEMELIQQKKKLIKKLTKARIEKGLSQSALANLIYTKQPAIARMESEVISEVSFDFLAKVALALDISFTLKKED